MAKTYYGVTAVARFEGRRCTIAFEDPLSSEMTTLNGRTFPLAADFTVPLAVMLAETDPKKLELALLSKRSCRRRGRRRQKPRKSVRQTLFHCSVLHRQRDRKPNRITLLIYSNIRMTFPGLSRPVRKRRMVGATGFELEARAS